MTTLYLAGPMRGYDQFNAPAFDAAEADLITQNYEVINPIEWDRDNGFDLDGPDPSPEELGEMIGRDLMAIIHSADAVVVLPEWDRSRGAKLEVQLARFLGKPVLTYPDLTPLDDSILDEAKRITEGARNADYGNPENDFAHIAGFWSAHLGQEVTPRDVAVMMILLKLGRVSQGVKRDNWVDIAGYARCGSRIEGHEAWT